MLKADDLWKFEGKKKTSEEVFLPFLGQDHLNFGLTNHLGFLKV